MDPIKRLFEILDKNYHEFSTPQITLIFTVKSWHHENFPGHQINKYDMFDSIEIILPKSF